MRDITPRAQSTPPAETVLHALVSGIAGALLLTVLIIGGLLI